MNSIKYQAAYKMNPISLPINHIILYLLAFMKRIIFSFSFLFFLLFRRLSVTQLLTPHITFRGFKCEP